MDRCRLWRNKVLRACVAGSFIWNTVANDLAYALAPQPKLEYEKRAEAETDIIVKAVAQVLLRLMDDRNDPASAMRAVDAELGGYFQQKGIRFAWAVSPVRADDGGVIRFFFTVNGRACTVTWQRETIASSVGSFGESIETAAKGDIDGMLAEKDTAGRQALVRELDALIVQRGGFGAVGPQLRYAYVELLRDPVLSDTALADLRVPSERAKEMLKARVAAARGRLNFSHVAQAIFCGMIEDGTFPSFCEQVQNGHPQQLPGAARVLLVDSPGLGQEASTGLYRIASYLSLFGFPVDVVNPDLGFSPDAYQGTHQIIAKRFLTGSLPQDLKWLDELHQRNPGSILLAGGQEASASGRIFDLYPALDAVVMGWGETGMLDAVAETAVRDGAPDEGSRSRVRETLDGVRLPGNTVRLREPLSPLDFRVFFASYNPRLVADDYHRAGADTALSRLYVHTASHCSMGCIFCMSESFFTQSFGEDRQKILRVDVEDVIGRLKRIRQHAPQVEWIYFSDDNFFDQPARVKTLFDRIDEEIAAGRLDGHLRFTFTARLDALDRMSEELLSQMARLGTMMVTVGVESTIPRIVKSLGKGLRTADEFVPRYPELLEKARRAGIPYGMAFIILFTPEETLDDTMSIMRDLVEAIADHDVTFSLSEGLAVFPGTELYQRYLSGEVSATKATVDSYDTGFAPRVEVPAVAIPAQRQEREIFLLKQNPGLIARYVDRWNLKARYNLLRQRIAESIPDEMERYVINTNLTVFYRLQLNLRLIQEQYRFIDVDRADAARAQELYLESRREEWLDRHLSGERRGDVSLLDAGESAEHVRSQEDLPSAEMSAPKGQSTGNASIDDFLSRPMTRWQFVKALAFFLVTVFYGGTLAGCARQVLSNDEPAPPPVPPPALEPAPPVFKRTGPDELIALFNGAVTTYVQLFDEDVTQRDMLRADLVRELLRIGLPQAFSPRLFDYLDHLRQVRRMRPVAVTPRDLQPLLDAENEVNKALLDYDIFLNSVTIEGRSPLEVFTVVDAVTINVLDEDIIALCVRPANVPAEQNGTMGFRKLRGDFAVVNLAGCEDFFSRVSIPTAVLAKDFAGRTGVRLEEVQDAFLFGVLLHELRHRIDMLDANNRNFALANGDPSVINGVNEQDLTFTLSVNEELSAVLAEGALGDLPFTMLSIERLQMNLGINTDAGTAGMLMIDLLSRKAADQGYLPADQTVVARMREVSGLAFDNKSNLPREYLSAYETCLRRDRSDHAFVDIFDQTVAALVGNPALTAEVLTGLYAAAYRSWFGADVNARPDYNAHKLRFLAEGILRNVSREREGRRSSVVTGGRTIQGESSETTGSLGGVAAGIPITWVSVSRGEQMLMDRLNEALCDRSFVEGTLGELYPGTRVEYRDITGFDVRMIGSGSNNYAFLITPTCADGSTLPFVIKAGYAGGLANVESTFASLNSLNRTLPGFVPREGVLRQRLHLWSEEYIPGKTLAEWEVAFREGEVTPDEIALLRRATLEKYVGLFACGYIYDPKPDNLVLSFDRVDGMTRVDARIIDVGEFAALRWEQAIQRPAALIEWFTTLVAVGGYRPADIFAAVMNVFGPVGGAAILDALNERFPRYGRLSDELAAFRVEDRTLPGTAPLFEGIQESGASAETVVMDASSSPPVSADVREAVRAAIYMSGHRSDAGSDETLDRVIRRIREHVLFRVFYESDLDRFAADLADQSSTANMVLLRVIDVVTTSNIMRNREQMRTLWHIVHDKVIEGLSSGSDTIPIRLLSVGVSDGAELATAAVVIDDALKSVPDYDLWKGRIDCVLTGIDIDPTQIAQAVALLESGYDPKSRERYPLVIQADGTNRNIVYSDRALSLARSGMTFRYLVGNITDDPRNPADLDETISVADIVLLNNVLYQLSPEATIQAVRRLGRMKEGAFLLTADIPSPDTAEAEWTPFMRDVTGPFAHEPAFLRMDESGALMNSAWRRNAAPVPGDLTAGESGETSAPGNGETLTRREFIKFLATCFATATAMSSPGTGAIAAGPAEPVLRLENDLLGQRSPLFKETFQTTYEGVMALYDDDAVPYNQTPGPYRPTHGWVNVADFGFLWDTLVLGLCAGKDAEEICAVLRRSLAAYERLAGQYGLPVHGARSGILPAIMVRTGDGLRPEAAPLPGGRPGEGVAYAAYDTAITVYSLMRLQQIFAGGIIPGIADEGIAQTAGRLLKRIDLAPFVGTDGMLRSQAFVDSAGTIVQGEGRIDNRWTEARVVCPLIAGGFLPRSVWDRMYARWAIVPAGDMRYAVLEGDAQLSAYTEFFFSLFYDESALMPTFARISHENYLRLAQDRGVEAGHRLFVSAPGTGRRAVSYGQFGLMNVDTDPNYSLVPAGAFLALASGSTEAVHNAETIIQTARETGAVITGWGMPDALDPRSGRAFNEKYIFMNQVLCLMGMGYPFLREIEQNMPWHRDVATLLQETGNSVPPPFTGGEKRDGDLLHEINQNGAFTRQPAYPGNEAYLRADRSIEITYALDAGNTYAGFWGKLAPLEVSVYRTLLVGIAPESVIPSGCLCAIELKDQNGAILCARDLPGIRDGGVQKIDLGTVMGDVAEIAIVFKRGEEDQNGRVIIDRLELSPVRQIAPGAAGESAEAETTRYHAQVPLDEAKAQITRARGISYVPTTPDGTYLMRDHSFTLAAVLDAIQRGYIKKGAQQFFFDFHLDLGPAPTRRGEYDNLYLFEDIPQTDDVNAWIDFVRSSVGCGLFNPYLVAAGLIDPHIVIVRQEQDTQRVDQEIVYNGVRVRVTILSYADFLVEYRDVFKGRDPRSYFSNVDLDSWTGGSGDSPVDFNAMAAFSGQMKNIGFAPGARLIATSSDRSLFFPHPAVKDALDVILPPAQGESAETGGAETEDLYAAQVRRARDDLLRGETLLYEGLQVEFFDHMEMPSRSEDIIAFARACRPEAGPAWYGHLGELLQDESIMVLAALDEDGRIVGCSIGVENDGVLFPGAGDDTYVSVASIVSDGHRGIGLFRYLQGVSMMLASAFNYRYWVCRTGDRQEQGLLALNQLCPLIDEEADAHTGDITFTFALEFNNGKEFEDVADSMIRHEILNLASRIVGTLQTLFDDDAESKGAAQQFFEREEAALRFEHSTDHSDLPFCIDQLKLGMTVLERDDFGSSAGTGQDEDALISSARAAVPIARSLIAAYEGGDPFGLSDKQSVQISTLIRTVQAYLNDSDTSPRIALELPDDEIYVEGSTLAIWVLIDNLIRNAREAVRARYPEYHSADEFPPITVRLITQAGRVLIEIEDQGVGIEPRDGNWDHVFAFRYTTKEARSSAEVRGVGLAICQEIVSNLGGTIVIARSVPGEGTMFRAALPAADAPTALATATDTAAEGESAEIVSDFSDPGAIRAGSLVELEGERFKVTGDFGAASAGDPYNDYSTVKIAWDTAALTPVVLKKVTEEGEVLCYETRHISHPNIMKGRIVRDAAGNRVLISEFVSGRSIDQFFLDLYKSGLPLPEKLRRAQRVVRQVASAFDYLDANGLDYGDAKSAHLLVSYEDDRFVLIDMESVYPAQPLPGDSSAFYVRERYLGILNGLARKVLALRPPAPRIDRGERLLMRLIEDTDTRTEFIGSIGYFMGRFNRDVNRWCTDLTATATSAGESIEAPVSLPDLKFEIGGWESESIPDDLCLATYNARSLNRLEDSREFTFGDGSAAAVMTMHNSALRLWARRGVRNARILHIDPHNDASRTTIEQGREVVNPGSYLFWAAEHGLVDPDNMYVMDSAEPLSPVYKLVPVDDDRGYVRQELHLSPAEREALFSSMDLIDADLDMFAGTRKWPPERMAPAMDELARLMRMIRVRTIALSPSYVDAETALMRAEELIRRTALISVGHTVDGRPIEMEYYRAPGRTIKTSLRVAGEDAGTCTYQVDDDKIVLKYIRVFDPWKRAHVASETVRWFAGRAARQDVTFSVDSVFSTVLLRMLRDDPAFSGAVVQPVTSAGVPAAPAEDIVAYSQRVGLDRLIAAGEEIIPGSVVDRINVEVRPSTLSRTATKPNLLAGGESAEQVIEPLLEDVPWAGSVTIEDLRVFGEYLAAEWEDYIASYMGERDNEEQMQQFLIIETYMPRTQGSSDYLEYLDHTGVSDQMKWFMMVPANDYLLSRYGFGYLRARLSGEVSDEMILSLFSAAREAAIMKGLERAILSHWVYLFSERDFPADRKVLHGTVAATIDQTIGTYDTVKDSPSSSSFFERFSPHMAERMRPLVERAFYTELIMNWHDDLLVHYPLLREGMPFHTYEALGSTLLSVASNHGDSGIGEYASSIGNLITPAWVADHAVEAEMRAGMREFALHILEVWSNELLLREADSSESSLRLTMEGFIDETIAGLNAGDRILLRTYPRSFLTALAAGRQGYSESLMAYFREYPDGIAGIAQVLRGAAADPSQIYRTALVGDVLEDLQGTVLNMVLSRAAMINQESGNQGGDLTRDGESQETGAPQDRIARIEAMVAETKQAFAATEAGRQTDAVRHLVVTKTSLVSDPHLRPGTPDWQEAVEFAYEELLRKVAQEPLKAGYEVHLVNTVAEALAQTAENGWDLTNAILIAPRDEAEDAQVTTIRVLALGRAQQGEVANMLPAIMTLAAALVNIRSEADVTEPVRAYIEHMYTLLTKGKVVEFTPALATLLVSAPEDFMRAFSIELPAAEPYDKRIFEMALQVLQAA